MVVDLDIGTLLMMVFSTVGAFWGLLRLMFGQFERRQDEKFAVLGATMAEQKDELDGHMQRQDSFLADIRRVETTSLTEIRRVENDLHLCRIDAANRFVTKEDAKSRHQEIIDAITGLANRIDALHRSPGMTQ